MLFAGWEVRILKNDDRGHSFSLYGSTLSRQITFFFFSCEKLAYNWVYTTLFSIELVYVPPTNHRKKSNERTSE